MTTDGMLTDILAERDGTLIVGRTRVGTLTDGLIETPKVGIATARIVINDMLLIAIHMNVLIGTLRVGTTTLGTVMVGKLAVDLLGDRLTATLTDEPSRVGSIEILMVGNTATGMVTNRMLVVVRTTMGSVKDEAVETLRVEMTTAGVVMDDMLMMGTMVVGKLVRSLVGAMSGRETLGKGIETESLGNETVV